MGSGKFKVSKVVTILAVVAILVCAFWIMANKMGLASEYDFGAGAYYYTDIPGYEEIFKDDVYKTSVPYWVHVSLGVD